MGFIQKYSHPKRLVFIIVILEIIYVAFLKFSEINLETNSIKFYMESVKLNIWVATYILIDYFERGLG